MDLIQYRPLPHGRGPVPDWETLRMVFTKRLREGVKSGAITCSVRIWQRPKVTVGKRYQMEEGHIEIESIEQIAIQDITHGLAVESGFLGVIDLLKVAKHEPGNNVYLIRFRYIRPRTKKKTT